MNTTLMRLILVGALAVALLGATAIVGADTNEIATGDEEAGLMNQMVSHMADHVPGDHHDGDHAERHAGHAEQHGEHHAGHAGHHAEQHGEHHAGHVGHHAEQHGAHHAGHAGHHAEHQQDGDHC